MIQNSLEQDLILEVLPYSLAPPLLPNLPPPSLSSPHPPWRGYNGNMTHLEKWSGVFADVLIMAVYIDCCIELCRWRHFHVSFLLPLMLCLIHTALAGLRSLHYVMLYHAVIHYTHHYRHYYYKHTCVCVRKCKWCMYACVHRSVQKRTPKTSKQKSHVMPGWLLIFTVGRDDYITWPAVIIFPGWPLTLYGWLGMLRSEGLAYVVAWMGMPFWPEVWICLLSLGFETSDWKVCI